MNLPMYVGYSRNVIKPLYDPLSPDLIFKQESTETEDQWRERLYNGIDLTERKSINFTNSRSIRRKRNFQAERKKEVQNETEEKAGENKMETKPSKKNQKLKSPCHGMFPISV